MNEPVPTFNIKDIFVYVLMCVEGQGEEVATIFLHESKHFQLNPALE